MALTYGAQLHRSSIGNKWLTQTKVTLDNSYPTGGYTLDGLKLGLTDGMIQFVLNAVAIPAGGATGLICSLTEGGKLQIYRPAKEKEALEEVPNATDLHLSSVLVSAIGK